MPLSGTAAPAKLLNVASMPDVQTDALTLEDVAVVHSHYEVSRAGVLELLPLAVTTSIPAAVFITGFGVPQSPWGPFNLVQVRLGCRAGVRGRGLLIGAIADSADAAVALEARWGFLCVLGEVQVSLGEREASLVAGRDGTRLLDLRILDLEPVSSDQLAWPASLHAARVSAEAEPERPLLVQVDPEYEFSAAVRGTPSLAAYDPRLAGSAPITPDFPIAASAGRVRLHLPALRYLVDPEQPVATGTRRVQRSTPGA